MTKLELKKIIKEIFLKEIDSGFKSDFGKKPFKSQYGKDPEEVLTKVQETLEKQVEWALTDVMDKEKVDALLKPIYLAVSEELKELTDEKQNQQDQWPSTVKSGGWPWT